MNITIGNEPWRTLLSGADPEYQEQAARERLSHLPEYAAEAGFTADEQEQLAKETAQLSASPDLLELWDRMTRIINTSPNGFESACTEPQFETGGVRPFPLYLMIVLAGVPYMEKLYKECGWYETAWREALLDIRIWMEFCRENYGEFGISMGYPWIIGQQHGRVIRLGRLQCNMPGNFFSTVRVYRNEQQNMLCAMINRELPFDRDGMWAFDEASAAFHTAMISEDEKTVTGYVSSPRGIVSPRPVTLDKSEWKPYLTEKDQVINLHIPADGPMKPELCMDSFRKMLDFHRNIMHADPKAFVCSSWLLDPVFGRILSPDSNIIRFQRFGHLLPSPGGSELVCRVFGVKAVKNGIDSVPHKTSMQKICADYARSGGKFRNGAFFIPIETLDL